MSKKDIVITSAFLVVLLTSISTVYGSTSTCSGDSGAIWALHSDGSSDDYFALGEDVYLGGQNFMHPNTEYHYALLDMDNNKSVETSGTVWTDANGDIIVKKIWTIPSDDYPLHRYRVDLIYAICHHKIWTKKDSFGTIPEYPTVAIPAILALSGYLTVLWRRRNIPHD